MSNADTGTPRVGEKEATQTVLRRTLVCRNKVTKPGNREPVQCRGGGNWGLFVHTTCRLCKGTLTELGPTYVTPLYGRQS